MSRQRFRFSSGPENKKGQPWCQGWPSWPLFNYFFQQALVWQGIGRTSVQPIETRVKRKNWPVSTQIFNFSIQEGLDNCAHMLVRHIPLAARTAIRHNLPVHCIFKNCGKKGPFAAHFWFYRMDSASFLKKDAVAIFLLADNRPAAGNLAEFL